MKIKRANILRDTLYNTDTDCTKSADRPSLVKKSQNQVYAQGILVGVVGTLMAITGDTLEEVKFDLIDYLPSDLDIEVIPNVWQDLGWFGKDRTYK